MGNEEVTDLDPEEAKLRQEMEDTRTSMTEKLERLETKVASTVEGAANAVTETVESVKGAVEGTVETVKESVQGTVEAVKDTFNLSLQVDRHPWLMVGGSVAVGFAVGHLVGGSTPATETTSQPAAARKPHKHHGNGFSGAAPEKGRTAAKAEGPSLLGKLTQQFGPEIDKLKGLALGAMLGLVRDMVNKATPPQVGSQIAQVIDDITCKLGGKPIAGPVSEYFAQDQPAEETGPPREKASPVGAASFPGRGGFERG
jgi:ElaB/YqjD/DUF883 family membrane-anchored ribosome-binding protein